jgi:uncharacterized protein YpiB (UPF0302 family)
LREFDKSQPLPFEMGDEDDSLTSSAEEGGGEPNSKEIDYSIMSKGDLQRAIDSALDDKDYARVKEITDILNKKYPQK